MNSAVNKSNLARRFVLMLAALAIVAPSAVFAQNAKPKGKSGGKKRPPPLVVVDSVRQESYRQTIPVIGRFVARQSGVIAAQVAGAIAEFHVDVGDRVDAGDILAVLGKNRLKWQHDLKRAEMSQFNAQVKTKRQEVVLLRQELKRLESLRKSPAFSQARLDDKVQQIAVAESAAAEAQAKLGIARANQKLSEINLQDAEVKAPHAGIVTKRHTAVGAYVNVGAPVITLLDDQTMEIEADVPSDNIAGVERGVEVDAVVSAKIRIKAMVRAIIPEENPRTRTRAVRFTPSFSGDAGDLIATNQSVVLQMPAGPARDVLTVHKDAVMTRKGRQVVVLSVDGKAQMRPVKLGPPTGSRFVVDGGLKEGDLVIVRGNERLLPGTPVRHKPPAPAADGKAAQPKKAPS